LGAEKHIFLMIFAVLLRKNSYFFVFLHKSEIFCGAATVGSRRGHFLIAFWLFLC